MRPDLMTASVDDVMTKNPKTISPDLLASEALEILNSSKITALIVTEGKKPVGIVHLHDILRARRGLDIKIRLVIASVAKQSRAASEGWIASSQALLAMTAMLILLRSNL